MRVRLMIRACKWVLAGAVLGIVLLAASARLAIEVLDGFEEFLQ